MAPDRRATVVVVDDDADGCEVLARAIELDGHLVHRAAGHDELVALVGGHAVDLVVLALENERESSNQRLLEQLRSEPGLTSNEAPALLIGRSGNALPRRATQTVLCDEVLNRPFSVAELHRAVTRCLARDDVQP